MNLWSPLDEITEAQKDFTFLLYTVEVAKDPSEYQKWNAEFYSDITTELTNELHLF